MIRKLPARRPGAVPSSDVQTSTHDVQPSARVAEATARQLELSTAPSRALPDVTTPAMQPPALLPPEAVRRLASCDANVPSAPRPARAASAPRVIEPLAHERYKVQFTGDRELKRKLELARDLSRHALPGGDLADIVARALDLLIEQLMKRRFAASSRPNGAVARRAEVALSSASAEAALSSASAEAALSSASAEAALSSASAEAALSSASAEPVLERGCPDETSSAPAAAAGGHIPNGVRRAVFVRDGGRCTWRGPDGMRCDCRAWLEYDHTVPRALGGGDDVTNIRLLCGAHNRLAAELAFGRATMGRIVDRRRRPRSASSDPSSPAQRG